MALTVAQVVAKVRARHPAFDRHRVPDRALGEYLSLLQQELFAEVALRYPDYLAQTVAVALAPTADGQSLTLDGQSVLTTATENGYLVVVNAQGQPEVALDRALVVTLAQGCPLPPAIARLLSGVAHYNTPGVLDVPLAIVDPRDALRPARRPAVYVVGTTLYLAGAAPACDFGAVASLELRYLPTPPPDFAGPAGVFLLREDALPALVALAVAYAAERVAALAPDAAGLPDPGLLAEQAAASRMLFLDSVASRRTARITQTRRASI